MKDYIKYNDKIVEYTNDLEQKLLEENIDYEIGYICSDCGCFTPEDKTTFVTNDRGYENPVCEVCISDSSNYFFCDDCNNWYDYSVQYYTTEDDRVICEHCRYEDYYECDDCGAIVHRDDIYYCNDCDRYLCEGCWDNHYHEENLLYDYHSYNDWCPQHTVSEPTPDFYIGHELEIDCGDLCEEVVDTITSHIPAICMHDGSLSDDGIEIISHPLSYNKYLELSQSYENLFSQLAQNYGYKSHNTDTCGLHFHVTRPDDEVIDRILLFMETYKEEIIKLSRRKNSEISDWCNFLSDRRTETSTKEIKSLDYIKKNKETSTRYMALNLTNSRTIEFRIFKGTLKYETFMADLEFVYNLTTLASDLSLPIEELTWTKVTSMGKFLPQYVEQHNLKTDKPIIDYSLELITERNNKVDNIKKDLNTLYKKVIKGIHIMTQIDSRKKNQELVDPYDLSHRVSWLTSVVDDLRYIKNNEEYDDYTLDRIIDRIKYIEERLGE